MIYLTRTDAARNIDRFYIVDITPDLFGRWSIVREWGRRGSPGTLRLDRYEHRDEAEAAERRNVRRRLQRGYTANRLIITSESGPRMTLGNAAADRWNLSAFAGHIGNTLKAAYDSQTGF
jgi:predicted DNA-binding WGR domain protein